MAFEEWMRGYEEKNYGKTVSLLDFERCWNASAEEHKPRWIPIEERKPIKYGYYPCLTLNLEFWVSRVFDTDKNEFISYDKDFITHWLELPELPE